MDTDVIRYLERVFNPHDGIVDRGTFGCLSSLKGWAWSYTIRPHIDWEKDATQVSIKADILYNHL